MGLVKIQQNRTIIYPFIFIHIIYPFSTNNLISFHYFANTLVGNHVG